MPLLSTDPKKANVGMLWEADQDAHRRIAAHRPPSATSIHSVAVETEEEDEAEVVRRPSDTAHLSPPSAGCFAWPRFCPCCWSK